MQKLIYSILLAVMVIMSPACKKYTDLVPKGKNVLNRVSDLDLLLNYYYVGPQFNFEDIYVLDNDMYPFLVNVPTTVNSTSKTLTYVYTTYDETIDRANLVTTDNKYERLYPIIANVCNVVLANADGASGDRSKAEQLKAEAYVLRAYCHWLLVNMYAKAYDPATAETDGGIPYVKDIDVGSVNKKVTVAEVYKNLLADVDAAFALNSLPDVPANLMRVGKGFAYGVKAKILMSMRNYTGALEAANAALTLNSTLEDHRTFLPAPTGTGAVTRAIGAPDNIFFAAYITSRPLFYAPSLELVNNYYEPGNIIKNYTSAYIDNVSTSGIPGNIRWGISAYSQNAGGLTTADLYLIKAECLIRTNKISDGMDVVNKIRQLRIHPSQYSALSATTEAQAMAYFMKTDRIEHLYTYNNFFNIKRWNTEGTYKQTISRTVNNVTYSLKPESKLWILPFPQSATNYNETLTQNY